MECQDIASLGYSEFSERMHAKVVRNRVPLNGTLELTSNCNLKCVHCYVAPVQRSDELDTKEIFRIMDEIAEAGCLWLTLTGGEPLFRPDFEEIYQYAKKKGLIITLFTNATLMTEKIADIFAEYPPFSIEVSIYGATAQTYECVTQKPGSFHDCIRGINLIKERNLPLKLKTMALTLNRHELELLKEYAESINVSFRFDPIIIPRLDGSKRAYEFRLTPEEVVELDRQEEARMEEWAEFWQRYSVRSRLTDKLFLCGAGRNSFHINYLGKLSTCEMYQLENYDLRKGSFAKGWFNFIHGVIAQHRKHSNKCNVCNKISLCGQCPGWSYLEFGDRESAIEYLCEVTELRHKAIADWSQRREMKKAKIRNREETDAKNQC